MALATIIIPILSSDLTLPKEICLTLDNTRTPFLPEEEYRVHAGDWHIVQANRERYVQWMRSAIWDTSGREEPFRPDMNRVNRLDSYFRREPLSTNLSVIMIYRKRPGIFTVLEGRHRTFWMGQVGAKFIPLMVPSIQHNDFTLLLAG